ncbi:MAG TPA: PHP domain-containing protein [Dehalococcoidia bacterium]|nr:PHP domain-containing protein [Dehalococcoidia bacterium]
MKFDLHTHTTIHSGCSRLTPQQLVERARAVGLDGLVITEHDAQWTPDAVAELAEQSGLVILTGMEVSTDLGHVLAYGLPKYLPGIYRAKGLREAADEVGAVLIQSHPLRLPVYVGGDFEGKNGHRMDDLLRKPILQLVDSIEIYNAGRPPAENEQAAELAEHLGWKGIGAGDAHTLDAVGACVTVFEEPIRTMADLVHELRAGRYHAAHQATSTQVRS